MLFQSLSKIVTEIRGSVRTQHEITAPKREFKRETAALVIAATINSEWLVSHLPPVAIRTVKDGATIKFAKTWLGRQLVNHTGGQEQFTSAEFATVLRTDAEVCTEACRTYDPLVFKDHR